MNSPATQQEKEADRLVNVLLHDVTVTAGFRAALFAACGRSGLSPSEFVIKTAAEQLAGDFSGVFEPDDITCAPTFNPFEGDQERTTLQLGSAVVTKAEKAAFSLHKPADRGFTAWAVDLMRERVMANVRRVA